MSKLSFVKGIVVGTGIVIVLIVMLFFALPEIYLYTENRNFAAMRGKSKLNCQKMPLHCLVRDEDIEGIEKYINSERDSEIKDNWGRTALYWALWNSKPDIAIKLLNLEVNPNTKNGNGISIFQQAVVWGKYNIANQLLEKGADIDTFNGSKYPETTLHHCVIKNNAECVRYLIENKANIYLKDSFGYTVFERVQMHKHIDKEIGQLFVK